MNKPKTQNKIEPEVKGPSNEPFIQRSFQSFDMREEVRRSEDRIFSKLQIPSINEIEFEFKN